MCSQGHKHQCSTGHVRNVHPALCPPMCRTHVNGTACAKKCSHKRTGDECRVGSGRRSVGARTARLGYSRHLQSVRTRYVTVTKSIPHEPRGSAKKAIINEPLRPRPGGRGATGSPGAGRAGRRLAARRAPGRATGRRVSIRRIRSTYTHHASLRRRET